MVHGFVPIGLLPESAGGGKNPDCLSLQRSGLLSTLLDVAPNEFLCVRLEDTVDFVQEIIQLGLDLLALLGRRRSFLDLGVLLGWRRLADLLSFSHLALSPHLVAFAVDDDDRF